MRTCNSPGPHTLRTTSASAGSRIQHSFLLCFSCTAHLQRLHAPPALYLHPIGHSISSHRAQLQPSCPHPPCSSAESLGLRMLENHANMQAGKGTCPERPTVVSRRMETAMHAVAADHERPRTLRSNGATEEAPLAPLMYGMTACMKHYAYGRICMV